MSETPQPRLMPPGVAPMTRSSRVTKPQASRARLAAIALGLMALLLTGLVPAAASAAGQSWTARLGTAGRFGTVSVVRAGSGAWSVAVNVRNLRASSAYDVRVNRGSCSVLGRRVTTPLMRFTTSRSGTFSRTAAITDWKGYYIRLALMAGPVAIRVGTHCGYLTGPTPTPTPVRPTPTPDPTLPPGLGVPAIGPNGTELIVLAAEPWSDPGIPTDPGDTLVTVQVRASGMLTDVGPNDLLLRDSAGADHAPLAGGRAPELQDYLAGYGGSTTAWVTFPVPIAAAADVVLRWTVAGVVHEIPLHVAAAVVPPLALSLATTTGLDGAQINDAVGTPGGYVAVGWTTGPAPGRIDRPAIWTSADGLAWQARTLPTAMGRIWGVARATGGRLVAVGDVFVSPRAVAAIWTSADDGATWARVTGLPTDAADGVWRDVTAFGDGLVVVGSAAAAGQDDPHAAAMTSADGLHWTRSTSVEGANCRGLDGVTAGGPGLIGWGTLWDCDTVAFGAVAWWSATGTTWTKAPDADYFISPDTGGGTSRAMQLVFGGPGDWTAIATWLDVDGVPLAYTSTDGKTWARRSVGSGLRQFWPAAAIASGEAWLLGGFAVADAGSAYSYLPQAWLGTGADWVRLPVEVPDPPAGSTAEYRVVAFADGPAGRIAIGGRSGDVVVGPVGAVWTIGANPAVP